MLVFETQGKFIIVIANEQETVPTIIQAAADLLVVGGKITKNRWA